MNDQSIVLSKVWIATADMGYGHLRAVYPLKHFAEDRILILGQNDNALPQEKRQWSKTLQLYSSFSRVHGVPLVGKYLFKILDTLQYIPPIERGRDLTHPTYQVRLLSREIGRGLCRALLERLTAEPRPLLTSFYAPAIAADRAGHKKIYCIICDTEVNRVWVAENPKASHITYLVPCEKAIRRLQAYGVPEKQIRFTGFPLPIELVGNDLSIAKRNFDQRMNILTSHLGASPRPLTIMYCVGGTGAQKEIGARIARSLREFLSNGTMRLVISAGIRKDVYSYFKKLKSQLPGADISIVFAESFEEYFNAFTDALTSTDLLWTKPSELSFYSGLGIPIILSPAVGAHEVCNERWLIDIGAGIPQQDPRESRLWLPDIWRNGQLASAARQGYECVKKDGTQSIISLLIHT